MKSRFCRPRCQIPQRQICWCGSLETERAVAEISWEAARRDGLSGRRGFPLLGLFKAFFVQFWQRRLLGYKLQLRADQTAAECDHKEKSHTHPAFQVTSVKSWAFFFFCFFLLPTFVWTGFENILTQRARRSPQTSLFDSAPSHSRNVKPPVCVLSSSPAELLQPGLVCLCSTPFFFTVIDLWRVPLWWIQGIRWVTFRWQVFLLIISMNTCLTCLKPVFFSFQDAQPKDDQETPSVRMNNYFI